MTTVRILGFGSVGRRAAELCDIKKVKVSHIADSKTTIRVDNNLASLIALKKSGKPLPSTSSNIDLLEKSNEM